MKKALLFLSLLWAATSQAQTAGRIPAWQVKVNTNGFDVIPITQSNVQTVIDWIDDNLATTSSVAESLADYMLGTNIVGADYVSNYWTVTAESIGALPGTNMLPASYNTNTLTWEIFTITNAVWVLNEATNFTASLTEQVLILGYPSNALHTPTPAPDPLATNLVYDMAMASPGPLNSATFLAWAAIPYWTVTNALNATYATHNTNTSFQAVTAGVYIVDFSVDYAYGGTIADVGFRVAVTGTVVATETSSVSWRKNYAHEFPVTLEAGDDVQVDLVTPDGGFLYNSRFKVFWSAPVD